VSVSAQHFKEVTNGYEKRTSGLWTHKGNVDVGFLRTVQQANASPSFPTTGVGLEMYYNPANGVSAFQSYDRDNMAWKDLSIAARNITLAPQSGGTVSITSGYSWVTLSLASPWASYGSPWGPGAYRKFPDGTVRLRGLVQGGAIGTNISTLPAGYRPGQYYLFVVANATGAVRIDVYTDGSVTLSNEVKGGTYSTSWTSLNEVSFLAEQ